MNDESIPTDATLSEEELLAITGGRYIMGGPTEKTREEIVAPLVAYFRSQGLNVTQEMLMTSDGVVDVVRNPDKYRS